MSTARKWSIYSYPMGFRNAGGFIESSTGRPYAELRKLARKMRFSGDGQYYEVREALTAPTQPDDCSSSSVTSSE